jgi:hypothetical protein
MNLEPGNPYFSGGHSLDSLGYVNRPGKLLAGLLGFPIGFQADILLKEASGRR